MIDAAHPVSVSDLADPSFSGRTQRQRVRLTLHTALAQRIFKGAPDGPVGIMQFARMVQRIWVASAQDDPYADLFLLRIYDAIIRARRRFQQWEREYTEQLLQHTQVSPVVAPLQIPLALSTPYAFMAVYLLVDLDVLTQVLDNLEQCALISKTHRLQKSRLLVRDVRRIFSQPLLWRNTGVTRQDIQQGTAKALLARQQMGALDKQIVLREVELPYSPARKLPYRAV